MVSVALAPVPNGQHSGKALAVKPVKTKAQLKRLKAKAKKLAADSQPPVTGTDASESAMSEVEATDDELFVNESIEYVPETLDVEPGMEEFSNVFARFQLPPDSSTAKDAGWSSKGEIILSDEDMPSDDGSNADDEDAKPKTISKRKQRKMARLSVAELKQLVKKPEVVEWTDISASDPRLLLHLKSYRNSIPVPPHWSAKRDYLQGKRGVEKAAFQLPSFIADTGIATMRDAVKEKEATMSLKAKTRERVQPKMGKMDIDYQKLHDAFFKFQTKPNMTAYGQVYYEGKEFETHLKEKRPGELSPELVEALSIPPLAPPPWLISMQRFGPPPSYPTLRIPGLNAPIPEGAQWGFHPGGWGKPPLDEYNRPLYGDVFGVLPKAADSSQLGEPINRELWGELEPEEEESEESESEAESDEEMEAAPADGLQTPSGMETPSGLHSVVSTVPGGLETPDFLELRKNATRSTSEAASGPRQLYHVVGEKQTTVRGLMGSERGYDLAGLNAGAVPVLGEDRGTKRKANGVDISIDAAELESMTDEQLRARYDAVSRGSAGVPGGANREDFSDLIAKEMRERDKKKQRVERNRGKEKDYKF